MSLIDLERRLRENRDDTATWLVYADALQESGDPRGDVIALGERLRQGDGSVAAKYAERCRAARWPRDAPFPRMHYRVRFEQMFAELRAHPAITVEKATIDEPMLEEIPRWREVAGAYWPTGMEELYTELAGVDLEWVVTDTKSSNAPVAGGIHIPSLDLWDYDALENELWFDFLEGTSPLHDLRPIDRFIPEAYTVLYCPAEEPSKIAYHYCGERLVPTDLTYREWLELLFRSRGTLYWIQLATSPERDNTWVGDGVDRVAQLFPDLDPGSMRPAEECPEVDL
jgi:uncharacterized protein (TIGR02996 family)